MASIKSNFVYNLVLTLSTYVIGLITYPYVSRILQVELMGQFGFVTNVIGYFSLFAMLGISTIGIREIAACGSDEKKRSQVFSSLLVLTLIFTVVVLFLYLFAIISIPE
ncbi:oligosaccharide flippase family protein, partial [Bacteroidales bacterium OttesenSCG-928-M06]|nr:oligosaccharide flippase family protein [Bacteroidales bacterium OttesenSCG-928-M06]